MTLSEKLIYKFDGQIRTLLGAVRRCERFLSHNDDWVEQLRKVVWQAAHRLTDRYGRPAVRQKHTYDYVTTVRVDSDRVEQFLDNSGYQRNLISTRKHRVKFGQKSWANGSWVLDGRTVSDDVLADDMQHHVYLFDTDDGECDVYAHTEPSVLRPSRHSGGDEMEHATALGLYDLFDRHGVAYYERSLDNIET
jgi:hypothetical protein